MILIKAHARQLDPKLVDYSRKGQETVVGPMPPFGALIKTSDDLWKMIAWIRSVNPSSMAPPALPPPQ